MVLIAEDITKKHRIIRKKDLFAIVKKISEEDQLNVKLLVKALWKEKTEIFTLGVTEVCRMLYNRRFILKRKRPRKVLWCWREEIIKTHRIVRKMMLIGAKLADLNEAEDRFMTTRREMKRRRLWKENQDERLLQWRERK